MEAWSARRSSAEAVPAKGYATRVTVSTFGVLAGLAGIEHGVGETLQGNAAPDGVMILSWPESETLGILAGEPAMTIVPNLLVTGVLAVLVSLVFLVWATAFVGRKHGGLALILLSAVMLLVGGGFGPPILGTIVGLAATRMTAPVRRRAYVPGGLRRFLALVRATRGSSPGTASLGKCLPHRRPVPSLPEDVSLSSASTV